MPPSDTPETPKRPPSDAENAMAANARSRDRQGKAEDKARREHHADMIDDGAKARSLGGARTANPAPATTSPLPETLPSQTLPPRSLRL